MYLNILTQDLNMMEEAVVTSKGQVTIPKEVRESLNIKDGSKIIFIVERGEAVIMPKVKNPLEALKKLREKISFTKEEITQMIKASKREWSKLN